MGNSVTQFSSLAQAQAQAALFTNALGGVLVDKSGSMYPYVEQVTNGINQLVADQSKLKGTGDFTLAEFSNEYSEVLQRKFNQLSSSFRYDYQPSGGTCLYKSILEMTDNFEKKLKALEKKTKVIIAIVTDGEDSGCGVSVERVKALIEKKKKEGWEYVLLGSDPSTLPMAKSMGIEADRTAFFRNGNVDEAFKVISGKLGAVRKGKKAAITEQEKVILALPAGSSKSDL